MIEVDRKFFAISLLALLSAVAHGQYNVWKDRGVKTIEDQTSLQAGSKIENPYGSVKLRFVYPTYKELPLVRIITQVEDGVPLLFGDPAGYRSTPPLGSPSPAAKGGYIERIQIIGIQESARSAERRRGGSNQEPKIRCGRRGVRRGFGRSKHLRAQSAPLVTDRKLH